MTRWSGELDDLSGVQGRMLLGAGSQEEWAEVPPSGHQGLQPGQASLSLKLGLKGVC